MSKLLSKNPNKKEKKEQNSKERITIATFNTGTRTHKSKKDYNRKEFKKNLKKMLENS